MRNHLEGKRTPLFSQVNPTFDLQGTLIGVELGDFEI